MKNFYSKICLNNLSQTNILANLNILIFVAYFEFACYLLYINPERIGVERFRFCNKAFKVFLFKCLCVLLLIVHQIYLLFFSFINISNNDIDFSICIVALSLIVIILNINKVINYRTSIFPIPYYGDHNTNRIIMYLLNVIIYYEYYLYINYECGDIRPIYFCIIMPMILYFAQSIFLLADFIDEYIKIQNNNSEFINQLQL